VAQTDSGNGQSAERIERRLPAARR